MAEARTLVRAVLLGLSVGSLLLVAGLAALLVVMPRATGSTPLTVLTSSMEPTLPPGTLVVVRPKAVDRIRVGEIATYQIASGRPEVVTHRVVAITSTSAGERLLTFRGDANAASDAPVSAVQVQGVVWYSVPLLGWANEAVNGHERPWLVPAIAAALFAYASVMILLGVRAAIRGPSGPRTGRRSSHGRRAVRHGRRRCAVHVDVVPEGARIRRILS